MTNDGTHILNQLNDKAMWVYQTEGLSRQEAQRRLNAIQRAFLIHRIVERNWVALRDLERQLERARDTGHSSKTGLRPLTVHVERPGSREEREPGLGTTPQARAPLRAYQNGTGRKE